MDKVSDLMKKYTLIISKWKIWTSHKWNVIPNIDVFKRLVNVKYETYDISRSLIKTMQKRNFAYLVNNGISIRI